MEAFDFIKYFLFVSAGGLFALVSLLVIYSVMAEARADRRRIKNLRQVLERTYFGTTDIDGLIREVYSTGRIRNVK